MIGISNSIGVLRGKRRNQWDYSRVYVVPPGAELPVWQEDEQHPCYENLQTALDAVEVDGEIWVAEGTYKPTKKLALLSSAADYETNDIYKGWFINKNITIRGGFVGDETEASQANPTSRKTIFDGDFAGDGVATDFAYKLFYIEGLSTEVSFKGFTVKNVYPRGTVSTEFYQLKGGAFTFNYGTGHFSNITFTNCKSSGSVYGAAVYSHYANSDYEDCLFHDINVSSFVGCINIYYGQNVVFKRTTFRNVSCAWHGACFYGHGVSGQFYNCLFDKCYAGLKGSVLSGRSNTANLIKNCTLIAANNATLLAGYNDSITTFVHNSVIYGNGSNIYNGSQYGTIHYYNSFVKDSGGSSAWALTGKVYDQGSNIDGDPGFADYDNEDYTLAASSQCIDAGDNALNAENVDLVGNFRVVDGDEDSTDTVDIGCFEFQTKYIDVFILAGQSNASGSTGVVPPSPLDVNQQHIYSYNTEGRYAVNDVLRPLSSADTKWGPELKFGNLVTTNFSKKVCIIKVSMGSTSLKYDWQRRAIYYEQLKTLYPLAIANLVSLGYVPRFKGLMWMQGETDASSGYHADYYDNFLQMIEDFELDLNITFSDIALGRISSISGTGWDGVRAAQDSLGLLDNISTINTDDLPKRIDNLHYTDAGQVTLGERFYNALSSVL